MKSKLICINKQSSSKNNRIKKNNEFNNKKSIKRQIKPLKRKNNKIIISSPFIFDKINSREDKEKEKSTNKDVINKLEYYSNKLNPNIQDSNKKKLSIKKILNNSNIKGNNLQKLISKEKNGAKINLHKHKIKNIILNNINKKYYSTKNDNFEEKSKKSNDNTKLFKENINHSKLDIYTEYNYYNTKNNFNKSRTKALFIKNNFNYLNSTDNSSSLTKNTVLFNKKNITRENSISNNKTIISDNSIIKKIKKLNKSKNKSLNRNEINDNNNKLKNTKIKKGYRSSKNSYKNIFNFKEYYYKKLKENNEIIKEINTLEYKFKNKNKKNLIQNRYVGGKLNIDNKSNLNTYISTSKEILCNKLSYTSRKQCKLKTIFFKKYDYSLDYKKDLNSMFQHININDKEMNKISILIKSNWGNPNKINFINIFFIDTLNQKINIQKANYDFSKPYINQYNKGETKILTFYFDIKTKIKNIEIVNGFDDSGIKSIIIENEKGDIIWRGIIPKKTLVSNKPYIILLNNIIRNIKKKNQIKNKNASFDLDTSLLSDKLISPYKVYTNKSIINSDNKNKKDKKSINKKTNINISIKKRNLNETLLKKFYKNETYDRDNDENLIKNITSFIKEAKSITPIRKTNVKNKIINIDYQLCDRIKIKLLLNYGNSKYIGLSGIEFYDQNDSLIDIETNNNYIKINEKILNNKQIKILYNLFNGKNDSTDPKNMFVTKYEDAFIEIDFKQKVKIKKIIVYNYNNNNLINCSTKKISIIFFINKKPERTIKAIYLNKNIGEEGIEYSQILKYPFYNCFGIKKYKNLNKEIKYNFLNSIIIYNKEYEYFCPSYPSGFILKFVLLNNFGNDEYIGLEQIQLFDENHNEIETFIDEENIEKKDKKNIPYIYLLPEKQKINGKLNPIVLKKYKNEDNKIYIIFNNLIMLSKIKIYNYFKYDEIAVKDIKIFIDDNIIFEGELNKKINEIYFYNNDKNNTRNNAIITNENERYSEKILENGTKILSLI